MQTLATSYSRASRQPRSRSSNVRVGTRSEWSIIFARSRTVVVMESPPQKWGCGSRELILPGSQEFAGRGPGGLDRPQPVAKCVGVAAVERPLPPERAVPAQMAQG